MEISLRDHLRAIASEGGKAKTPAKVASSVRNLVASYQRRFPNRSLPPKLAAKLAELEELG